MKDGRWKTTLVGLKAGGPVEMTVTGDGPVKVSDILVGDVWLGSGQSIREYEVGRSEGGPAVVAQANFPQIRLFSVPRKTSGVPAGDVDAKWVICSPESVREFSAVLYFFGRQWHQDLRTPIGLILNSAPPEMHASAAPRSMTRIDSPIDSSALVSEQVIVLLGP